MKRSLFKSLLCLVLAFLPMFSSALVYKIFPWYRICPDGKVRFVIYFASAHYDIEHQPKGWVQQKVFLEWASKLNKEQVGACPRVHVAVEDVYSYERMTDIGRKIDDEFAEIAKSMATRYAEFLKQNAEDRKLAGKIKENRDPFLCFMHSHCKAQKISSTNVECRYAQVYSMFNDSVLCGHIGNEYWNAQAAVYRAVGHLENLKNDPKIAKLALYCDQGLSKTITDSTEFNDMLDAQRNKNLRLLMKDGIVQKGGKLDPSTQPLLSTFGRLVNINILHDLVAHRMCDFNFIAAGGWHITCVNEHMKTLGYKLLDPFQASGYKDEYLKQGHETEFVANCVDMKQFFGQWYPKYHELAAEAAKVPTSIAVLEEELAMSKQELDILQTHYNFKEKELHVLTKEIADSQAELDGTREKELNDTLGKLRKQLDAFRAIDQRLRSAKATSDAQKEAASKKIAGNKKLLDGFMEKEKTLQDQLHNLNLMHSLKDGQLEMLAFRRKEHTKLEAFCLPYREFIAGIIARRKLLQARLDELRAASDRSTSSGPTDGISGPGAGAGVAPATAGEATLAGIRADENKKT